MSEVSVSADLETQFDNLPTYPGDVDFAAMPTGLLRMIKDRKPGPWPLKATEALEKRGEQ